MSEGFRRPPTRQEGHLPPREVSLLPGGQNPIALEYQIHPPTIDTLVTGMSRRTIDLMRGWPILFRAAPP